MQLLGGDLETLENGFIFGANRRGDGGGRKGAGQDQKWPGCRATVIDTILSGIFWLKKNA